MSEHAPISIVGAGKLTRALLPALHAAGRDVAFVFARRAAQARSAVRGVSGTRATSDLARAASAARLLLLAVPDRELAGLARRLADLDELDWRGRVVLHHAGALGPEPLTPLQQAGAETGLLHPLQSLGGPGAAAALPGSRARIEGSSLARRVAAELARDLGLVPLRFRRDLGPADRAAYHAAASLASNDLVALLGLGLELLQRQGLGRKVALQALLPLARGTLDQLEREGLKGVLTGPAVRGDVDTLEAHLRSIGQVSREGSAAHRLLALRLMDHAEAHGARLPRDARRRLRNSG